MNSRSSNQERRAVLRIIDANANRCREGLRVAEDIFRLGLEDGSVSRGLKELRHDLEKALKSLARSGELLAARDAANDPGSDVTTVSEGMRTGLTSVLRANLRRSQESLRVLEEASKLLDQSGAAAFKNMRFRCYAIEKELDGRLSKTLLRRRALPGKRRGKGR